MESVRPFFQFLHKFIDLSEEEFDQYIKPYIEVRQFKRKEVITKPGDVENYINFVLHGLVRKYYRKGKEEMNVQIATEGHIVHSQESFHSRIPSEYTVEAIENTALVSVSFE